MKVNGMDIYVEKAMRSASRAAAKVLTDSLLHNRPLPLWVDGKVEYVLPTQEQIEVLKARSIRKGEDDKDA